jgi:hypothetical protein
LEEAVADVSALVARLRTPRFEGGEALHLDGALTPSGAAELIRSGETRTIVVRDPTQIALTGRAAIHALERLTVRCERPIRVVAITVASIGRDRTFEPRNFANEVFAATKVPTFDVYTAEQAA